jgi:AmiR/NasT family two-component response regulator
MSMTATTPASPVHILLVDDDRLVLATLSHGLQRAGYRVSSADSAEEAEQFLATGMRPDLAILDVRMPGNSGLQLAERLRQLDQIPFLMLSAYSDAATVEQANACGALSYLVKPIDQAQLGPAVAAALARAEELHRLNTSRQQLQAALDSERDTSIAVGITMAQQQLGRDAAFALLRNSARSQRCKLATLAAQMVQDFERKLPGGLA